MRPPRPRTRPRTLPPERRPRPLPLRRLPRRRRLRLRARRLRTRPLPTRSPPTRASRSPRPKVPVVARQRAESALRFLPQKTTWMEPFHVANFRGILLEYVDYLERDDVLS